MIILNIILILLGAAMSVAILMQSRSAGMSGALGGGGGEGFHVRRGSEKIIFRLTVILSTLFLLVALAHLFI